MAANVPASIKARLLRRAHEEGDEFELFLVRYACERFLYRLSASGLRDSCVLKGAGLLTIWTGDPYRATRDIDLLASGPNDEETVREAMISVCTVPCDEDGLHFDTSTLQIESIRAEEKYSGQRAVLTVYLGKAQIRLQVDFAFGDVVTPAPIDEDYPTLLDGLPAPRIRTYPRETAIAEKFQAMVYLGRTNSRMKDFHDVWALSEAFAFDGAELTRAVIETFSRRETAWTRDVPEVLERRFYGIESLGADWRTYLSRGAFEDPPPDFLAIGIRVMEFLGPVREAAMGLRDTPSRWAPGGPWGE